MSINATVLFGTPQQEIASLLRNRLAFCDSASLVAGFLTVEGVAAIADPLRVTPSKLDHLVVGAGTYRAYAALDTLVNLGVPLDRLHVHLGHTRATTATAKHKFYRYHPMLHSKVYYLAMPDGTACAFIGSHNLTGFALLGLNGEASVLLEGDRNDSQFDTVRKHIQESAAQSVPYAPGMKEAYSWWTGQFLEGLRDKANDHPRDGEAKRTIVILARADRTSHPESGDKIYFEIPAALGRVQTTNAEVHLYMFDHLPSSPYTALYQLDQAFASLWCRVIGLEDDQGGAELAADWFVDDRRQPTLRPTHRPFRPTPTPDMQQVRIEAHGELFGDFEYLFDSKRPTWEPVLENAASLEASADVTPMLEELKLIPPEHYPWFAVRGLRASEPEGSQAYRDALLEASPESGSYVVLSLRRRRR